MVKQTKEFICSLPKCKREAVMKYMGSTVCEYHLDEHFSGKINLKEIFKIKEVKV